MKNRFIAVLLCALFTFSAVLSGCAGSGEKAGEEQAATTNSATTNSATTNPEPKEVRDLGKIKMVYLDWSGGKNDNKEENKIVFDAIQKKFLLDRNAKIDIELIFIPGDAITKQLNLKLAAAEDMDAFTLWNPAIMNDFLTKPGLAAPLDEILNKYGQNIKKLTDPNLWSAVTYEDKIWGIPVKDRGWQANLVIRKDLLDKAGLGIPKSMDELENAFEAFKGMGVIPILGDQHYLNSVFLSYFDIPIGHGCRFNPYKDSKGNIIPIMLHPNYKEYIGMLQKWVAKGWLPKDYTSYNLQQVRDTCAAGKVGCNTAATTEDPADIFYPVSMETDPAIEWSIVSVFEGKKYGEIANVFGTVGIFARSRKAEAVVEYLDWLYSDEKNFYLAYLGVEGVHYTADWDKRSYNWIGNYKDATAKYAGVYMFGHVDLQRATIPALHEAIDLTTAPPLAKKKYEYIKSAIWDYMEKMPESSKLKNPIINTLVNYSQEDKNAMGEVHGNSLNAMWEIILEGKSLDEGYKKVQELQNEGWAKYGKIITDQLK